MRPYSMNVMWSASDKRFVATSPEIRDVSALGKTPEKAVAELKKVISLALEVYREEGWPTPEPKLANPFSGQLRLRLPKSLHAWLATEANREGLSLNYLIVSNLSNVRGQLECTAKLEAMLQPAIAKADLILTFANAWVLATTASLLIDRPQETPGMVSVPIALLPPPVANTTDKVITMEDE